jgi:lipopolysaccharide assembly outer membrane protein LptD (OstA)
MRLRMWLALVGGGMLSLVVVTTAQRFQPSTSSFPDTGGRVSAHADQVSPTGGQVTFTGTVNIEVNGVTVQADRVVIRDGEYRLEGNVRMKVATP